MRLSKLRTIRTSLAVDWQSVLLYAGLVAGAVGLLTFHLRILTAGYSGVEGLVAAQSQSWQYVFNHPLHAPFLAAIKALSYVYHDPLFLTRLVSATMGLVTIALFYGLLRYWHNERTAIFGSILFGTSAWFLHISRLGDPSVLLFGVLALTASYVWLTRTASGWALLSSFILVAVLLYVPGMIWFIMLGVIWQWRAIDHYFKRNLWAVTLGGVLLLGALVPMGFAIYHHPELAKTFAGLPAAGWPAPLEVLKNLGHVPFNLFVAGPVDPEHWLGKVALIDFFTTAMFALGAYVYLRNIRLRRFWFLAAVLILGSLLISLGGGVTLTLIVPFIYLIAAAGINFMLGRWLTVFPRNVIAQSVGYGLVCVALLVTAIYTLRHYFVAWPSAPATRAVFTVTDVPASVTMKE